MSGTKKGSSSSPQLYSEWSTIDATALAEEKRGSVLHKLPNINGQGVVNAVVKPLVAGLSFGFNGGAGGGPTSGQGAGGGTGDGQDMDPANYLQTDRDVQWVMEVICYGLSLQISTTEQHEAVRDCVHIYCEWMHVLIPNKSEPKFIPFPIRDDPNRYFRRMIQHLFNVFIRRTSFPNRTIGNQDLNVSDIVSRQAVLCHRVLRTLETVAEDVTNIMDRESWDAVLIFLLAANDTLLSPPSEKEDIGTHLCERIVIPLFEIWLIACHKCFPSPSFWKTFHEMSRTWRHRSPVIEQWTRVCLSLTHRLVQLTYATDPLPSSESAVSTSFPYVSSVLKKMNYEVISQTWFRFLHTLGNPVDLCYPEVITKTSRFNDYTSDSVVDPRQHPCLNTLPHNFYRAMKGVAILVDVFLGIPVNLDPGEDESKSVQQSFDQQPTPPSSRKPHPKSSAPKAPHISNLFGQIASGAAKGGLASPSATHPQNPTVNSSAQLPVSSGCLTGSKQPLLSNSRPKVNSVLNVLGNWLFSASLIGSDLSASSDSEALLEMDRSNSSASIASTGDGYSRKGSLGTGSDRISIEISSSLTPENFEAGQAEAIGALCRLFSSKRTDEDILPVYLARFYLAIQHGLTTKEPVRGQVLSSILMNSTRLFQLDLNGVNILIPHYLKAMEMVFSEKDPKARFSSPVPLVELRRSCITLMLSLLVYPLHFNDLPIKDCLSETASVITFQSLRPRLINLLINALHSETDSTNAQMLLAGFLACVQDAAANEAAKGVPPESESSQRSRQSPFTSENVSLDSPENTSLSWYYEPSNNEPSSLASTDIPAYSDAFLGKGGIPDTARGLFARTLYLVCHFLVSNWKNDTQFALAALEVLSGLARVQLNSPDSFANIDECKRATKWICDYIINQCSRPPPYHSKIMHSTIVAAYQSLTVWFNEHSYLLQDRECINTLLEVIELGITGSKKGKNNLMKAEKELKPASMRVREAAESLLTCLMDHFGFCPSAPFPPDAITGTSLLDEASLLKQLGLGNSMSTEEAYKCYRYFVNDSSIILSVLRESSLSGSVCIIRSAFGKYCWSLKYQLLPRNYSTKSLKETIPRSPVGETPIYRHKTSFKYFPDSVDNIPLTKLDMVVPTLESVVNTSPEFRKNHEKMRVILEKQTLVEKQAHQRSSSPKYRSLHCKQPEVSSEFESARLILSHFGFLSLEGFALQETPVNQAVPSLVAIDSKNPELVSNLRVLDMISTRTNDTVFVYYVRKGRVDAQEILNNVSSKHYVTAQFLEFLTSLGNSIDVKQHSGWTGNVSSSWKVAEERPPEMEPCPDHGGCIYDGLRKALYWADVSHEIAFVVPSGKLREEEAVSVDGETRVRGKGCSEGSETDKRSLSSFSDEGTTISSQSRTFSDADSYRGSWRSKKNKQIALMNNIGCDTKILVIWLENTDDQHYVPIDSLISTASTGLDANYPFCKDYFAIFIHPLKNGLFRISLNGSAGRTPFALPLIDGIVISKRILASFVRLTALNLCRRRRLDAESYQPAHVKRRLKIQDITNKFKQQLSEADFCNNLFF